jgi:hypothetical protein
MNRALGWQLYGGTIVTVQTCAYMTKVQFRVGG